MGSLVKLPASMPPVDNAFLLLVQSAEFLCCPLAGVRALEGGGANVVRPAGLFRAELVASMRIVLDGLPLGADKRPSYVTLPVSLSIANRPEFVSLGVGLARVPGMRAPREVIASHSVSGAHTRLHRVTGNMIGKTLCGSP